MTSTCIICYPSLERSHTKEYKDAYLRYLPDESMYDRVVFKELSLPDLTKTRDWDKCAAVIIDCTPNMMDKIKVNEELLNLTKSNTRQSIDSIPRDKVVLVRLVHSNRQNNISDILTPQQSSDDDCFPSVFKELDHHMKKTIFTQELEDPYHEIYLALARKIKKKEYEDMAHKRI